MTTTHSLFETMQANLAASPIRIFWYAFGIAALTCLAELNQPIPRPLYMRGLGCMIAAYPIAFCLALIHPLLSAAPGILALAALAYFYRAYLAGEIRRM